MDEDVEQQNTSRWTYPRFNAGRVHFEVVSTSRFLQQGSIQHDIMTDRERNFSLFGEHEQDNSTNVDITQCASTSSGRTSRFQDQETLFVKLQSLENGYNMQLEKIIAELNKKKMAEMSVLLAKHATSQTSLFPSKSEKEDINPANTLLAKSTPIVGGCVMEVNYHKDMDPENGSPGPRLTDDLVVEVLSRLPFKSFCRFKCVSKDWLAFSSDPQYSKKLLKIPTGLLYQHRDNSAIRLASLPHNDKEFDETLSFLPQYEQLELMDSCNGLVLCKYKSSYTPEGICRFIVCNPATREWRMLPDTPRSHYNPFYNMSILAFSPSWSAKFYVFNFQRLSTRTLGFGPVKLQVFSSDLSTWLLDDTSWLSGRTVVSQPHLFIDGALYVRREGHEVVVLKGLEGTSSGIPPTVRIIEVPLFREGDYGFMARIREGCFGQSSGALHFAFPEEDARTILVWSLDVDEPYEWSLKYRLSMSHAFGRDNLRRYDTCVWNCDYDVLALDLERDRLVLFDKQEDKLRLYRISTGELAEIQPEDHRCDRLQDKYYTYVASYSTLPALTM